MVCCSLTVLCVGLGLLFSSFLACLTWCWRIGWLFGWYAVCFGVHAGCLLCCLIGCLPVLWFWVVSIGFIVCKFNSVDLYAA